MKKIHALGLTLLAVFAFSVVAAATASAETTLQFLAAGAAIATALASKTTGELTLGSTNGGGLGIKVKVLCSGILTGTVGPGAADTVTGLLSLTEVAVTLEAPLLNLYQH